MRRVLLTSVLLGKACGLALWAAGAPPVLAAAVFFSPGLCLLYAMLAPSAQGLGRVVTRFAPEGREVWLTIDDGPDPEDTPRALSLLARHQAKATFFVIGERAARHPELIRAIVAAGHEVAHHTHTHPAGSFWAAGRRRVARELDGALAVFAASGVTPSRFRSPVGIKPIFLHPALAERRLAYIGWSLRSFDTVARDPAHWSRKVMRGVRPGSILLLHEGPRLAPKVRTEGLGLLLAALTEAGFRCVVPHPDRLR